MWSVRSIPAEDVPKHWHIVAPLLVDAVALSGGRYDMRAVLDGLVRKVALLWVIYDDDLVVRAAFTASRRQYPRAAWLCVEFLGGEDMASWVGEVDRTLTAYARDSGLAGLELVGRKGWVKALGPLAWRENAVMLVKSIEKEVV